MSWGYWWERFPGRLEYELEKLQAAGFSCAEDADARKAGIIRVQLQRLDKGQPSPLHVIYPDLYPYFRFEVVAPEENLPYHQNPDTKTLCLMGRSTHYWNLDDTAAGLIQAQVPEVITTALSKDKIAVSGKELSQAEPFSDFYPYQASMFLVQSDWIIPKEHKSGPLRIGLLSGQKERGLPLLQGIVLEVLSNQNKSVAKADPPLQKLITESFLSGRWVRADKPIHQFDPKAFLLEVQRLDYGRTRNYGNVLDGWRVSIWGVLFPEEVHWRDGAVGDGWAFLCHFQKERTAAKPGRAKLYLPQVKNQQTMEAAYFTRAGRAGLNDMGIRAPELLPLADKKVALFGVGCLGAPSALDLVRSGLGDLRVLDGDIVNPGTVIRWPLGMKAAGRRKVEVIREFIEKEYPYTKVKSFFHKLGLARMTPSQGPPDQEVLEKMTRDVSLIFDATAEVGVQHFLSDYARERGIPYLCVVGTYGGWGGKVIRIDPRTTEGCWLCARHAFEDGTFAEPPAKEEQVQPAGCGDPTYTGASFDMNLFATTAVRMAVSTLCRGQANAYPWMDGDVITIALRDATGNLINPVFQTHKLKKHPKCPVCSPP